MSATLRYDIGIALANVITQVAPSLLDKFGGKTASRWGGVYRERKACWTFAVKLPQQIIETFALLKGVDGIRRTESGAAASSARVLFGKLCVSLGMPFPGHERDDGERAFLNSVDENPSELATWLIYADWLEEFGDTPMRRRAAVIRAWTGKKATKVKYGVIVAAMGDRWDAKVYGGF